MVWMGGSVSVFGRWWHVADLGIQNLVGTWDSDVFSWVMTTHSLSLSLSLPPFHAHVTQHNSKIEKFRPPNCLPIHSKFPPSSPTTTTHVINTRVIRSFWLLDKKDMATLSKSRMLCLLYLMLWLAHHCYRITLKTFYRRTIFFPFFFCLL